VSKGSRAPKVVAKSTARSLVAGFSFATANCTASSIVTASMPASDGLRFCQSKRSGKYTGAGAVAAALGGRFGTCATAGPAMPAAAMKTAEHAALTIRRGAWAENRVSVMGPPGRVYCPGCYPSSAGLAW